MESLTGILKDDNRLSQRQSLWVEFEGFHLRDEIS
jgi:hypothetical protein